MPAYRLVGWGWPLELAEVPVRAPRGREVLLEVQAVGLCHSDLFVMAGDCAVLVIGIGGLGHLAVQILRATTSAVVVAVDPKAEACALAESLGAHHTAMAVDDGLARLASATGITGADVVLDFVGSDET